MSLLSIVITLIILGIIIFIHELGHFLTSKYFGIPVTEFALGMGPKITSFKRKGISINESENTIVIPFLRLPSLSDKSQTYT